MKNLLFLSLILNSVLAIIATELENNENSKKDSKSEYALVDFRTIRNRFLKQPPNNFKIKFGGKHEAGLKFLNSINALLGVTAQKDEKRMGNVQDLVAIVLELFVENEIFDEKHAANIAKTFGIKLPPHLNVGGQVLTSQHVGDFVMSGDEDARHKFLEILHELVESNSTSSQKNQLAKLTKYLLEALVENHICDYNGTSALVKRFGLRQGKIRPDATDTTTDSDANILRLKILGKRSSVTKFLRELYKLFEGAAPTSDSLSSRLPEFSDILLELLVANEIFNLETATAFASTLKLKWRANKGNKLLTPESLNNFTIGGKKNEKAVKALKQSLDLLLKSPEPTSRFGKLASFLDTVIIYLIDTKFFDVDGGLQLQLVLGVIDAEIKPPSQNLLNLQMQGNLASVNKFILELQNLFGSRPQMEGVLKDKVAEFAQMVLQFLIGNQILDPDTALKLTSTFGLQQNKTLHIESLDQNTLHSIKIGGKQNAANVFLDALEELLDKKNANDAKSNAIGFVQILLAFLSNNGIIDNKDVNKLITVLGIKDATKSEPVLKSKYRSTILTIFGNVEAAAKFHVALNRIVKGKPIAGGPLRKNVLKFVNAALQLLVDNNIFDDDIATKIAFVYNVTRHGNLAAPEPLTTTDLTKLQIRGNEAAREQLVKDMEWRVTHNPAFEGIDRSPVPFAKTVLRTLVLNDLIDEKSARKITVVLGFPDSGQVPLFVAQLTIRGREVAAGHFRQSIQVISNQDSNRDGYKNLSIFVNLLMKLLTENEIIDGSTASNLLANFDIAPVGKLNTTTIAKPYSNDTVAQIQVKGNNNGREKLISSLTKIVAKKNSPNRDETVNVDLFISAILKLLIDNSILDLASADQLNLKHGLNLNGQSISDIDQPQVHSVQQLTEEPKSEMVSVSNISTQQTQPSKAQNVNTNLLGSAPVLLHKHEEQNDLHILGSHFVKPSEDFDHVVGLLVSNKIIDQQAATAFGAAIAQPLRGIDKTSLNKIFASINGDQNSRERFIQAISSIFSKKPSIAFDHNNLSNLLLHSLQRLVIGNRILQLQQIKVLFEKQNATYPQMHHLRPRLRSLENITICGQPEARESFQAAVFLFEQHQRRLGDTVTTETLQDFLHDLIQLAVGNNVLDTKTAESFYSSSSWTNAVDFVKSVLSLLVENNILDVIGSSRLAAKYGIHLASKGIQSAPEKDLAIGNVVAQAITSVAKGKFEQKFNRNARKALATALLAQLAFQGVNAEGCFAKMKQFEARKAT